MKRWLAILIVPLIFSGCSFGKYYTLKTVTYHGDVSYGQSSREVVSDESANDWWQVRGGISVTFEANH